MIWDSPRCESSQYAVSRWPVNPAVWDRWGRFVQFGREELVWVADEREGIM